MLNTYLRVRVTTFAFPPFFRPDKSLIRLTFKLDPLYVKLGSAVYQIPRWNQGRVRSVNLIESGYDDIMEMDISTNDKHENWLLSDFEWVNGFRSFTSSINPCQDDLSLRIDYPKQSKSTNYRLTYVVTVPSVDSYIGELIMKQIDPYKNKMIDLERRLVEY